MHPMTVGWGKLTSMEIDPYSVKNRTRRFTFSQQGATYLNFRKNSTVHIEVSSKNIGLALTRTSKNKYCNEKGIVI